MLIIVLNLKYTYVPNIIINLNYPLNFSDGGQLVKLEDFSSIFFNLKEVLVNRPQGLDYAWTGRVIF